MSTVDPKSLPIREYAKKIIAAVKSNPVTIVIGETGSGKTTQISQASTGQSTAAGSRLRSISVHLYVYATMNTDP